MGLFTDRLLMILTHAGYPNASEIYSFKPVAIVSWPASSRDYSLRYAIAIIFSNGSLGISSGTIIAAFVLTG